MSLQPIVAKVMLELVFNTILLKNTKKKHYLQVVHPIVVQHLVEVAQNGILLTKDRGQ